MVQRRILNGHVQRARQWAATTPGRLRTLSTTITTTAIVLAAVGFGSLGVTAATVSDIHHRTVPAIVGVERIHALLSDADRSAANAYLAGGADATLALWRYTSDIAAVNRQLQVVSMNNPGGEVGSQRLQAIAGLVAYYAQLEQTATSDARQGIGQGTVFLQAGSDLMHQPGSGILSRVDSLRDIYVGSLHRADLTLQITTSLLAVYAAVAAVVLVVLVRTQRYVRARFRRRRNHRLIAATLVLVVLASGTGVAAVRAAASVRAAESQAYVRLLGLWQARALAYDANRTEGLSVIARGEGASFDRSFQVATAALVDRPVTDQMVEAVRQGTVDFNGLIADELRAATTTSEKAVAMQILEAYQRFLQADAAMRARVLHGDEAGATTLALGTAKGQLVYAFDELDYSLGIAIQTVQDQFDATIGAAELPLELAVAIQVLAPAIAVLAFLGLRPRIAEYTVGVSDTGKGVSYPSDRGENHRTSPGVVAAGRPYSRVEGRRAPAATERRQQ
jgi:hypothetical protein